MPYAAGVEIAKTCLDVFRQKIRSSLGLPQESAYRTSLSRLHAHIVVLIDWFTVDWSTILSYVTTA